MMVTNAILGGVADTVAQSITAIRERALRQPGGLKKNDGIAIEIHELDRKNPFYERDLIPDSIGLPPPFDFERLTRFMAYGSAWPPCSSSGSDSSSESSPSPRRAPLSPP
jgi:protein Mpv17